MVVLTITVVATTSTLIVKLLRVLIVATALATTIVVIFALAVTIAATIIATLASQFSILAGGLVISRTSGTTRIVWNRDIS